MKKLRGVFKCHGGKFYLSQWIISNFPKNYTQMTYIEGCAGAANILLNKQRSLVEIYNDADPNIVSIFQELTSDGAEDFLEEVKKTHYNEETFKWAKVTSDKNCGEQALAELVRRRFSRGGLGEAFAWSERLRGGKPGDVNAWNTYKELLPDIIERLRGVDVYCLPIHDLFVLFDAPNVLWYIDPPYLPSTRRAKKAYAFEMTEEDHIELGKLLNNAKGKVCLSGYQSPLYTKLYKNWKMDCRPIKNHSGQGEKKQTRIECVWMNY
jgi:DNA adenine methylase